MAQLGAITGGVTPQTIGDGAPFLYRTHVGSLQYVDATVIDAEIGIGYNDIIVVFTVESAQLYSRTFKNSTWSARVAVGTATAKPTCVFLDSNGNLFASGNGSGELAKSSNDGTTWTVVLDSTDLATDDYIRSMTESDTGVLMCTQYDSTAGLWKSTDSGDTWTKIVSNTFPGSGLVVGGGAGNQHMHTINFDPFRKVWLCSSGDASGAFIQVSDDDGVTWASWTATDQTVGITFDENYIYYSGDLSGDRNIHRSSLLTGTGVSVVTSATTSIVYDPTDAADIAAQNDAGHCWWGFVDENGVVMFAYGAAGSGGATGSKAHLIISKDQGDNWIDISQSQTYSENGNNIVDWAHDFASPSYYALSIWDKRFYHKVDGQNAERTAAWRVYSTPVELSIDNTNGVDYLHDGVNKPIKNPLDTGLPVGVPQNLIVNHTSETVQLGMDGAIINKGAFSFTGSAAVSPHREQDCENTFPDLSWTLTTNGTMNAQSTTQVQEGTNSVEGILTSTQFGVVQRVNVFTDSDFNVSTEAHVWMQYYLYPAAYTPTGDMKLAEIIKGSEFVRLLEKSTGQLRVRFVLGTGSSDFEVDCDPDVTLTQAAFSRIKIHWFRNATQGQIRVWVGDKLAADIRGIDSMPVDGIGDFTAVCGPNGAPTGGITYYVDNIKCSYADPDEPTDIVLNGTRQIVTPDGTRT